MQLVNQELETILKIKEVEFTEPDNDEWEVYGHSYEGYIVTTNKQQIKLGLTNTQICCEDWGYYMTEDNLDEFIGANLFDITVTDTQLNTHEVKPRYAGETMFVNFTTSKGALQFVCYNNNGYYGHTGIVESNQITEARMVPCSYY